jgi:hypothetical protein
VGTLRFAHPTLLKTTMRVGRIACRKFTATRDYHEQSLVGCEETSTFSDRHRALAQRLRAGRIGLVGSVRLNERVYRLSIDLHIWL